MKGRTQPAAPIDIALRSDAICHLQQMAITTNRKLTWDPARFAFVGDEAANRLLDRPVACAVEDLSSLFTTSTP